MSVLEMSGSLDGLVGGHFAECMSCGEIHPCKIVAGIVVFHPAESVDCMQRGEPAPNFVWDPAKQL